MIDRTLTSRFECKYMLDHGLVPAVRDFLSPFMVHDSFSKDVENHRYSVCSLYLDDTNLHLYQQTQNAEKNRFKLRIRTYGDAPTDPAFMEIKKRMDQIIAKDRFRVERKKALSFVDWSKQEWSGPLDSNHGIDSRFLDLAIKIRAVPIVQVKYLREAFESRSGDPVRITFDTQLKTRVSRQGSLSHQGDDWLPVPQEGTILEIKFSERFPDWVQSLVDTFSLQKRSVAKYVMSVDASNPIPHIVF